MLQQQENIEKTMRIKDYQKYINSIETEILTQRPMQLDRRHIATPASFNSLYKIFSYLSN